MQDNGSPPEPGRLLTGGEAAKILGVPRRLLADWAFRNQIPSSRTVGGHYRFRDDVIREHAKALNQEGLLRPADAARKLGVSVRTLARWAMTDQFPSVRFPAGHRRYREADVQALLDGDLPGGAE